MVIRPRAGGIPADDPAAGRRCTRLNRSILYAMISGYLKKPGGRHWLVASRRATCSRRSTCLATRRLATRRSALVAPGESANRPGATRENQDGARQQREAAAEAATKVAEADLDRLAGPASRSRRSSTRGSTSLVAQQAADAKLADEQMSDLAAAVAAERTGASEILSAKAKYPCPPWPPSIKPKADAAEAKANLRRSPSRDWTGRT